MATIEKYASEPFDWHSIKGRRVYGSDGALLGEVSEVELRDDDQHMIVLAAKRFAEPESVLRIPLPLVGVIAERGVFLDAPSRWAEEDADSKEMFGTSVA